MLTITYNTIDGLYLSALDYLMKNGTMTLPRGYPCLELSPFCTVLTNIQNNILTNPLRKASKRFMAVELLWILLGRSDVEMISFYNERIKTYSDDGLTFFGAYGPKIMGQLSYVENILRRDPWTRQAVLTIWRENPPATKDVPCTITMQFIRRPLEYLNLNVYMRSQDAWLGFPYDVHNFTCLQLILASILGLKPGKFTLIQGSFHAYKPDFKMINKMINTFTFSESQVTPLATCSSLEGLDQELAVISRADGLVRDHGFLLVPEIWDPLLKQKLGWLAEYWKKLEADGVLDIQKKIHETGGELK